GPARGCDQVRRRRAVRFLRKAFFVERRLGPLGAAAGRMAAAAAARRTNRRFGRVPRQLATAPTDRPRRADRQILASRQGANRFGLGRLLGGRPAISSEPPASKSLSRRASRLGPAATCGAL